VMLATSNSAAGSQPNAPASVQCYSSTSVCQKPSGCDTSAALSASRTPPPRSSPPLLPLPASRQLAQWKSRRAGGLLPQVFSGQPGPEPTYTTETSNASSSSGRSRLRVLVTSRPPLRRHDRLQGRFSFEYRASLAPPARSSQSFFGTRCLYGGRRTCLSSSSPQAATFKSVMLYLRSRSQTPPSRRQLKSPRGVITATSIRQRTRPSLQSSSPQFIQKRHRNLEHSASSQVNAAASFVSPTCSPATISSPHGLTSPVPQRIAPRPSLPRFHARSVPGLKPAFYPRPTSTPPASSTSAPRDRHPRLAAHSPPSTGRHPIGGRRVRRR